MVALLKFEGAGRLAFGVLVASLLLVLGPLGRAGAPMSAELQQKVDFEAAKIAPAFCTAYLKGSYDCTCFATAAHDYRMREFAQKGESMLIQPTAATEPGKTLDESLNDIVALKELDYSKCLLPGKTPVN